MSDEPVDIFALPTKKLSFSNGHWVIIQRFSGKEAAKIRSMMAKTRLVGNQLQGEINSEGIEELIVEKGVKEASFLKPSDNKKEVLARLPDSIFHLLFKEINAFNAPDENLLKKSD